MRGREVLSSIVSSQNELHAQFGGVVPEVASRRHTELVNEVVAEAMSRAGVGWDDLGGRRRDAGPGAHRRPAGGPGDGQGDRLPARAAPDPREPPAGAHRRQLRPRRRAAVRVPRRQRRAHAARRGGGGRALPRRRQDHGRRGRRGVRQGRPAAGPRATRAAGSSTSWRRAATRASPVFRAPSPAAATSASAASRRPCSTTSRRATRRRSRRTAPTSPPRTRRPSCASWWRRRWPAPPPRACGASPSPAAWPPTPACAAR